MTMGAIWTAVGDFFTGIFSAVTGVLSGIAGEPILLLMGIVIPVAGIVMGYVRRLLKRKG